jgi:hypothetical protein
MVKFNDIEYVFGCDPELFLFDTQRGCYVGAQGLVPGTKAQPHLLEGGMVQVDGLALEFGIDPARDEDEFVSNIDRVMKQIRAILPAHIRTATLASVEFTPEVIAEQLPENLELGCEPDYNAYNFGQPNPRPRPPKPTVRSAGGHIHIGWGQNLTDSPKEHLAHCCLLTQQLDSTVGAASLYWDKDRLRRTIYGKAGCFRPKPYGMEYRTVSNRWLAKEDYTRWAFRLCVKAIKELHEQNFRNKSLLNAAANIIDTGLSWNSIPLIDSVAVRQATKEGYLAL